MYSSVDTIWVLLGAALVFFMQAGFAMVETGLTRAKNAGNIIMKNLMDFALGTVAFWLAGFGIMFAGDGALIGGFDPFILGDYSSTFPSWAFVIFQTVFCATAATIVSGAMAERTKFLSYCIYSVAISLIVYPVGGHWVWGGGWLSQLGFHDFAGSTAVHMVGGLCALIGAKMVGPRIGKYTKDGKANAIPGHSLTLAALGCFILWFCWFGFNGCSTVSMTGDETLVNASLIFVNTNLAAAVATCVVMIITWSRYKKPDVSMTLNGSLAGLVAITAGCDAVDPVSYTHLCSYKNRISGDVLLKQKISPEGGIYMTVTLVRGHWRCYPSGVVAWVHAVSYTHLFILALGVLFVYRNALQGLGNAVMPLKMCIRDRHQPAHHHQKRCLMQAVFRSGSLEIRPCKHLSLIHISSSDSTASSAVPRRNRWIFFMDAPFQCRAALRRKILPPVRLSGRR